MEKMLENLYEMETKKNKNMKTAQNKKLETLYTFTPLLIKHTTCMVPGKLDLFPINIRDKYIERGVCLTSSAQ